MPQTRTLSIRTSKIGERSSLCKVRGRTGNVSHGTNGVVRRDGVWFQDPRCSSNHMTENKLWFTSLDKECRQFVRLGNNSRMGVMGRGNVRMEVEGLIQVIMHMYYILELKNKLLSIGQLQEGGLIIFIRDDM